MQQSFAKLYGTEDIFDITTTGLTDINLIIVSKSSENVRADLQSKGCIKQHFMQYQQCKLASADMLGHT